MKVRYCPENQLSKDIRSPLFVRCEVMTSEHGSDIYEVVKHKKVVEDHIPVASAFFILSHAKQHVLKVA